MMSGSVGYGIRAIFVLIASVLLVVELVSLAWSLSLTRTITRSVHNLYQGTQHVSSGDFSHQIPVRGADQLSALARSFNSMTGQIRHFIGEMRKKEKLESELEIAREVQARLFPRTVPELKTLESRHPPSRDARSVRHSLDKLWISSSNVIWANSGKNREPSPSLENPSRCPS